ncbi:DUF934 domain-containing protein [Aquamicrobium zhengzhouense]|uniref:DUF934 domain-containing protein n=1 Tax=Aquamicrobium zhengzhouense TaxID=2781738 RepID=A0ABS0SHK4_9HYPH|nr:DUF934 domain-containing protein [Aquamicrobium zhengzhouense]MBI1621908.1 DUF934 domain-containing protein [Aquamicrobium zhengzhouense]
MSDAAETSRRLWTEHGFTDDLWIRAEGVDALAGNRGVILPLETYLALDEEVRAANAGRLSVHLEPGDQLDAIVTHLSSLPLISLGFPAFTDGRSYSKAQLLRSRYRYGGIVRASGDVLLDQLELMLRSGFSEFEIRNETALQRLTQGRAPSLGRYYQPAERAETENAGFSWRRVPLN